MARINDMVRLLFCSCVCRVSLGQDLLQLIREPYPVHQFHVDEAGILLLNLLQLTVGGVGDALVAVGRHANQVRNNLKTDIDNFKLGHVS